MSRIHYAWLLLLLIFVWQLCNHPKLLLPNKAAAAGPEDLEDQQQQQQQNVLHGTARMADVAATLLREQLEISGKPVDAVELSGEFLPA